jgi:hypothetical protein
MRMGPVDDETRLFNMREQLEAPGFPVTTEFMATLTSLDLKRFPRSDLKPRVVYLTPSVITIEPAGFREAQAEYLSRLCAALPAKRGEAKWASAGALLVGASLLSREQRELLRPLAPEAFKRLSTGGMDYVLNESWEAIRSPAMVPVLLEAFAHPPPPAPGSWPGEVKWLRDMCLRRAHEQDPVQARSVILEAMRDPDDRFERGRVDCLLMLPDKTLPKLEEDWMNILEKDPTFDESDIVMRLLARYGSEKILPRVRAYFGEGPSGWGPGAEGPMLAYLLRVDEAYGVKRFRMELAYRSGGARSWADLFGYVAEYGWSSALEPVAIEALSDPSAEVASSAARALRLHGTAAVKEDLLKLLRQWTDTTETSDPTGPRAREIAGVLQSSTAWTLTPEDRAAIEAALRKFPAPNP